MSYIRASVLIFSALILSFGCRTKNYHPPLIYSYDLKGYSIGVMGFHRAKAVPAGFSQTTGFQNGYAYNYNGYGGTSYNGTTNSYTTNYTFVRDNVFRDFIANQLEKQGANVLSNDPSLILLGPGMEIEVFGDKRYEGKNLLLTLATLHTYMPTDKYGSFEAKLYNKKGELLKTYSITAYSSTSHYSIIPVVSAFLFFTIYSDIEEDVTNSLTNFLINQVAMDLKSGMFVKYKNENQ